MLILVGGLVAICSWIAFAAATHPIGPAAFGKFLSRQRLDMWHADVMREPAVRRYLATTRRWRVAGLAVAVCFSGAAGLRQGKLMVDLLAIVMGWFVGAIVAEWRLVARSDSLVRRATLVPRRLHAHISAPRLWLPWAVTAVVVALGGFNVLFGQSMRVESLITLMLVVIPAAAALTAVRYVVVRPVQSNDPAVDFALRSRSLHALSGAVMGNATLWLTGLVYVSPLVNPQGAWAIPLALAVIGLAMTWWIAVRPVSRRFAGVVAVLS